MGIKIYQNYIIRVDTTMAKIDKKPESFDFFGHNVYSANDLLDYDPNYFFGCAAGIRKIIEKKKIPETEYFYGSPSKAGWKKCTASYPKGKLLLKVDWVHENVPKMAINNDINYDIEPAPEILYLDDNEMFKSSDGKVLDIEVRGERNPKKCYFKVKDVARAFEMENLQNTIIDKIKDGYHENIHYKYFTINYNNKLKKVLFLTLRGLQRIIETNRNKIITENTKYVFHTWLNNNFNKKKINYDIDLLKKSNIDYGYVYCITSKICNGIKIGYWKGNINGLKKRYITYYGSDLEIYYFYTKSPKKIERHFFEQFIEYKINNEIYEKEHLHKYIDFFNNNILV